ncbi:MAG: serine hydrolase domain-containing protein [Pyrinomonadaceae bacterium]
MSIKSTGDFVDTAIASYLTHRINAGDFPSAVYFVAEKGEVGLHGAVGNAVVTPQQIEASTDIIYDLASLTKVLVTTLLLARALQDRSLSLDHRLAALLPGFDVEGKRSILLRDLLVHTSHLTAWKPLYLLTGDPSGILGEIAGSTADYRKDEVGYSDLNFIVLGAILEQLGGTTLNHIARELFDELGLASTMFNPEIELHHRIAASENGNEFEKHTCIEKGYLTERQADAHPFFRQHTIWGEVHDGNAYFMGGVAGHAGLFSTAGETFEIAQQFLPAYSRVLSPATCQLFRTNFTPGLNEHRSPGFQLASSPDSTAGSRMSPESFGHLGFTGTSMWIDPVKERVFILLTNRTHAHEPPFVNINSVRRAFHDMAVDSLEKRLIATN